MAKFAVICLAGPSSEELRRLNNLLESLFFWEPATSLVVLIDDSPPVRDLAALLPPVLKGKLVVLPNPLAGRGHYWDRGVAGMMAGLSHLATLTEIEFVVKVDTDALVIAPFANRVGRIFADNSAVGQVGAYNPSWYDHSPLNPMRRLSMPVRAWRKAGFPGFWLETALAGRAGEVRGYAIAARRSGYRPGSHVLGGGNAISAQAISQMASGGFFDQPQFWLGHQMIEDLLLSMLVRSVGLECFDDSGNGGIFGVAGRGLPGTPQQMLDRSHAIIHAVKNDPNHSEEQIVDFFRRFRVGGGENRDALETVGAKS
ncbi:MAG: hypothetical protein M0Z50_01440 [Planctomycetia bacterium]|nr:hypothetical protein [Planctomycetia bacterium]